MLNLKTNMTLVNMDPNMVGKYSLPRYQQNVHLKLQIGKLHVQTTPTMMSSMAV